MKKFLAFIFGIGVGAIVMSLITPVPGHEMRKKMRIQLKRPDINEKLSKIKEIFARFQVE